MSEATGPNPRLARILVVIGLLGTVIGGYSTYHHHKLVSDPGYESFCSIDAVFDCDDVNSSRWAAVPLGNATPIPVALLGFLFWAVLAGLAWIHFRNPGQPRGDLAIAYALLLSLDALLISAVMAFISYFVIEKVCIICTAWYVVAIAFPILASRSLSGSWRRAARLVADDLGKAWPRRVGMLAGWLVLASLGSQAVAVVEVDPRRPSGDGGFLETWKNAPRHTARLDNAYAKGSRDPKLDVVEFVDLECGACRAQADELRKLMTKYPEVVRLTFRHYPLDDACNSQMSGPLHRHACDAALAAECAGVQGEFWNYHDKLFAPMREPKPNLTRAGLDRSAEAIGLDMDEFATCMEHGARMDKIQSDLRAGASVGVRSTPTLVINGRKIAQTLNLAQWETIMKAEGIEVTSPEAAIPTDPGHAGHDH